MKTIVRKVWAKNSFNSVNEISYWTKGRREKKTTTWKKAKREKQSKIENGEY